MLILLHEFGEIVLFLFFLSCILHLNLSFWNFNLRPNKIFCDLTLIVRVELTLLILDLAFHMILRSLTLIEWVIQNILYLLLWW
jgi:hypothetical protein